MAEEYNIPAEEDHTAVTEEYNIPAEKDHNNFASLAPENLVSEDVPVMKTVNAIYDCLFQDPYDICNVTMMEESAEEMIETELQQSALS